MLGRRIGPLRGPTRRSAPQGPWAGLTVGAAASMGHYGQHAAKKASKQGEFRKSTTKYPYMLGFCDAKAG